MNRKYRLAQTLFIISGFLAIWAPSTVFAHDNIGGDELAAANWMLICAIGVGVMGGLAGIWAWRSGQFSNVEESKFSMLELSDDYDAIMAEVDAKERQILQQPAAQMDGVRPSEPPVEQRNNKAAPASPAARV